LSPARGQAVRLQRLTSRGWITVRHAAARPSLTFVGLPRGSYRLLVSATKTADAASARVRAA
jgi:hypothetical protein